MARAILEHPQCKERLVQVLSAKAVGCRFQHTVMMGQLPLSVAALTFETEMVELLLECGASIIWENSKKETVLHSLIRFASVHSDKEDNVLDMLHFINERIPARDKHIWHRAENEERMTPLKLAASLGVAKIFTAILNLNDVYRSLNAHDGLFDIHLYDITEIDTITQAEWERNNGTQKSEKSSIVGLSPEKGKRVSEPWSQKEKIDSPTSFKFSNCFACHVEKSKKKRKSWTHPNHQPALRHKAPAVLDIICQISVKQAFDFLRVDAVKELIYRKWKHYKWFFTFWAAYHLFQMIHITSYAIYKTKVINSEIYNGTHVASSDKMFVYVTSGCVLLYGTIYLLQEIIRTLYFRQTWHLRLVQHNGLYRVMLTSFSLALLIDTIFFLIQPHNNYFLILALILGWTFMTFFLRTWKRFSFYTVMFQKVLLGDMTRLSVIILFQLVAFSVAIYTTFLNSQPVPDGFENAGLAFMTMFKLMLGLADIEVLHNAREPWLSITLYILFVLVTYVLLFNSLIAMMSRTCDLISEDRNQQWELQRLSAIILLETVLLPRWRYLHSSGIKAVKRYGIIRQVYRCYVEVTSIQTTYREGRSVLQRKSMINTMGFGPYNSTSFDAAGAMISPFLGSFRGESSRRNGTQHGQDNDPMMASFHGYSNLKTMSDENDDYGGKGEDADQRLETLLEEGNFDDIEIDEDNDGEAVNNGECYIGPNRFNSMGISIPHDNKAYKTNETNTSMKTNYQKALRINALLRQRIHHLTKSKSRGRIHATLPQQQQQEHLLNISRGDACIQNGNRNSSYTNARQHSIIKVVESIADKNVAAVSKKQSAIPQQCHATSLPAGNKTNYGHYQHVQAKWKQSGTNSDPSNSPQSRETSCTKHNLENVSQPRNISSSVFETKQGQFNEHTFNNNNQDKYMSPSFPSTAELQTRLQVKPESKIVCPVETNESPRASTDSNSSTITDKHVLIKQKAHEHDQKVHLETETGFETKHKKNENRSETVAKHDSVYIDSNHRETSGKTYETCVSAPPRIQQIDISVFDSHNV